jgi:hypothetical protein
MNNQNKKDDVVGKPQAGTRDSKNKQAQLNEHPRKGRDRVPSTQDEIHDAKENKTSQEKVRIQQGGKNHRANTN